MNDNVVVVVPAYNSEKTISGVLQGLKNYNVVVINDGSADDTGNIVREFGVPVITHKSNLCVGGATKSGIRYALDNGFTHIISIDSDGQHPTKCIEHFKERLVSYDFVIGNRFNCPTQIPHQKVSSNCLGVLLTSELFKVRVKDVACGFRGFKVQTGYLSLDSNGYGFIFEHVFYAVTNKIEIGYVDIPAVYGFGTPLCTRRSELLGFLNAILKASPIDDRDLLCKVRRLRISVQRSEDWSCAIGVHSFYGFFVSGWQAYVIQTDFKKAVGYFEADLSRWYAMRALGIDGRSLNRSSRTPFAESARNNAMSRRVFLSDEHIVATNEYTITYDHLDRAGYFEAMTSCEPSSH